MNNAPANPLIRIQPAKDPTPKAPDETQFEIPSSPIAAHIRSVWDRSKMFRWPIDERLLACLRARRGVYSDTELAVLQGSGGLNTIFTNLTETKCRAGGAWIRDIVLPPGDRAWGLEPTTMPDLPGPFEHALKVQAAEKMRATMIQQSQQGQPVMTQDEFKLKAMDAFALMRDDLLKQYKVRAKAAADRMSDNIEDLMQQGGYEEAMDGFIEDFVTYPAAILKGPVFERDTELTWDKGMKPVVKSVIRPKWRRVSPFDFYPAPNVVNPQHGDIIERVRYTREELHSFIGIDGYNDDAIRSAVTQYSTGRLEQWLWTEAERIRLEQLSLFQWLSPRGTIDGLHFWGGVPGWMLLSWGVDPDKIDDPTADYEIDAILVGQYVIHAAVNSHPLKMRPYFAACYDAIPGAFWGRSIPDLAGPSQKMCNALASAIADNLSIASGPMAWVHADRMADGFNDLQLAPWKVFQLKSDPTQGTNPGIGFFQPDANIVPLQNLMDNWENKADDATGIPRYVYGNEHLTGAGATATGLQMLMDGASKGLRRAIGAIDMHVTKGTLQMAFDYEMMYGTDMAAKGDCAIVARGTGAVLIKAAGVQTRTQLLQTIGGNPLLMQLVGETGLAELMRQTLNLTDVNPDGIVPTTADIQLKQQQQAEQQQAAMQQQAQLPSPAAIEAQGTLAEVQTKTQSNERIQGARIAADVALKGHAAQPQTEAA